MGLEDVGVNLVVKGQASFASAMAKAQAVGVAVGMAIYNSAIAAGKAMANFAKGSITAASDMNETLNKTRVIFGDASVYIEDFAKTAASSLGLSQKAAMDAAGTFAIFFKSAGMSNKGAASFSMSMTKLSADLASFYNTSPEDAILAIGAALRGESEPIRRYGVLLDDASLRQKALKLGIVNTTKQALTPQQRVLAAYQLIMEQTAVAQGDFANTSEGLANQQRILAANLENVRAKVGQALLPVVNAAILAFNKFLVGSNFQGALDKLGKKIAAAALRLQIFVGYITRGDIKGAIISQFGPRVTPIIDFFIKKISSVKDAISELVKSFKTGGFAGLAATMADLAGQIIVSLITGLVSNQAKLLTFGLNIINGIATSLMAAIPNLIPVVVTLLNSIVLFITQTLPVLLPLGLQVIMTIVEAILAQLPAIFGTAVTLLVTLAEGIAKAIPRLIPEVVKIIPQIITTLINNLPALITAAIQIIMALANGLITSLPILIAAIPQIVTTLVQQLIILAPQLLQSAVELIGMLIKGIVNMLPQIGRMAGQIINTLVTGIGNLISSLWNVGRSIVEGVWNGISNAAGWFRSQVEGFFQGIIDGVKRLLGIKSPSKVFGSIGKDMALGLGMGFEKSFQQIEARVGQAVNGLAARASMAVMPGMGGRVVSAGPTTNNYSTSYNLSVMTNQSPQVVQQSFSIMRMLAG